MDTPDLVSVLAQRANKQKNVHPDNPIRAGSMSPFRQDIQAWRALRPARPDVGIDLGDYRNSVSDWRDTRPVRSSY
jgi:hypothetical protein